MIRKRLKVGGVPSLPELYPGEKAVESIEVSHQSTSTGHEEPAAGSSFLDTGWITLNVLKSEASQVSDGGTRSTSAGDDDETG